MTRHVDTVPDEGTRSAAVSGVTPPAMRARVVRVAAGAVVVAGLAHVVLFLACAALRLTFPWDLEWMEGGMITHAARVLQGEPIYEKPSLDFVAYFYTPLYPWLLAGLSYLTGGLSFALGRGVSLAATLLTFGMLFQAARREGGLASGLLAVALYAALFRTCGAFYDLARADALALSLAVAASLTAYYFPTTRGAFGSALLFVAAFFAKQTAAVMAPAVGLYLLTVDRRRALVFGATGISVGLALGAALDHQTSGWFRFYVVSGHQGHLFYVDNFLLKYWRDVLYLAPFLLLVPALGASYGRRSRWAVLAFLPLLVAAFVQRARTLDFESHMYYEELWYERERVLLLVPPLVLAVLLGLVRWLRRDVAPPPPFFLLLFVAGALSSDLNHSTQWAYSNCFMPIAVFGSLYAAITIGRLLYFGGAASRAAELASLALSLALLVQLVALVYDPREQVPNARDWAALERVIEKLDAQPGPVFMPAHPLYNYLRHGTVHVHQMGLGDVAFAGGVGDVPGRLARGEFPTVVEEDCCAIEGLASDFVRDHGFEYEGDALQSKTGFRVRPASVWLHFEHIEGTP